MRSWWPRLGAATMPLVLAVGAGPAVHAAQDSAQPVAHATVAPDASQDFEQRMNRLRTAMWQIYAATDALGTDARGRTLAQDLNQWVMSDAVRSRLRDIDAQLQARDRPGDAQAALQAGDALLDDQERRLSLIGIYWFAKPQWDRQRALWQCLLEQVPDADAQASSTRMQPFEARLQQDFSPTQSVPDLQRDIVALEVAYNGERLQLAAAVSARRVASGGSFDARERRIPCPPASLSDTPDTTGTGPGGKAGPMAGASPPPTPGAGALQPVRVLTSLPPTEFYPIEARRAQISGRVMLRLFIGVDGCVDEASIVRSSGAPELDQAAMDFSEYMRFVPAQRNGHAVAVSVQMPVSFQLQGQPSSPESAPAAPATGSLIEQSNALQRQALTHFAAGNLDAALSDSAAALRADPRAFRMDLLRARLLRIQHHADEAPAQAEAALHAGPDDPTAYEVAAQIYAASNQMTEAMRAIDHAVQIAQNEAPYLLRASWRPRTDLNDRRVDIDAALARNPRSLSALLMKVDVQLDAGAFSDAVDTLNAALRADGDPYDLLIHRGIAYAKSHQDSLAKRDFAAARAQAVSAQQLNDMCWTLATLDVALDVALSACDAAIAMAPDSAPIRDSRAFVLLRLGRYQESIALYDAALQKAPTNEDSLYGRGLARLRGGQRDAGHKDIEQALAIDATVRMRFEWYGLRP